MGLRHFVGQHRMPVMVIGGALVVFAGAMASFSLLNKPRQAKPTPVVATQKAPEVYYSPLTGLKVTDQAATTKPVTAVMLENSPSARPQSGVKQAEVVYEAIAEAGITRFLALYQQNKPTMIGPVRSLRPYYIDWLAPYQPSVAHVGGSLHALQEIRNGTYRDIDQFFHERSYWRATDRRAPHNVYTSAERLDDLNSSKGYKQSTVKTALARADGKPANPAAATVAVINFGRSARYNTRYQYDASTNTYQRSIGGEASLDREEGQIAPSVVVALTVQQTTVQEDGIRENIITTGQGKATIFQNGSVVEGIWRKADRTSPLELRDANGKAIALTRGQTWIAAVPGGAGSVSWQQ